MLSKTQLFSAVDPYSEFSYSLNYSQSRIWSLNIHTTEFNPFLSVRIQLCKLSEDLVILHTTIGKLPEISVVLKTTKIIARQFKSVIQTVNTTAIRHLSFSVLIRLKKMLWEFCCPCLSVLESILYNHRRRSGSGRCGHGHGRTDFRKVYFHHELFATDFRSNNYSRLNK